MQSTLGPGDEVMTGSGVYGTVSEINDEDGTISLEVSPEVVIRFARGAVAKVVAKVPQEEEVEEEADEELEYETDEADETSETDRADETDDDKVIERRD
jgi:preprotein translocase subunit YajC